MAQRRPRTLRTSLSLLAVACTLPVAVVAAGLVYFLLAQSYSRTQSEVADRRDLMAGAVELRLQNVIEGYAGFGIVSCYPFPRF